MTPRRIIAALTVVIIIMAVSLLYDTPTPSPVTEPTPTSGTNCIDVPARRGLGWEPWVLLEECD